ncbi:reverse transcriptase domain-containing protein [Tanacetum coccineum]
MTTQSTGRSIAAPQGGRTGVRAGRGGGRTGVPTGRVGGRTGDQDGQGGNRGNGSNGGVDKVPEFSTVIAQQLQNLRIIIASNFQSDVRNEGKGSKALHSLDLENAKSVQDMSVLNKAKGQVTLRSFIRKALTCPNNEMQKLETEFWCHAMVEAVHAAYTDRIHELARLVPYLVIPENKRIERYIYGLAPQIPVMVAAMVPTTIQSVVLKAGMLTDEAIRNGSLKKNTEKRGNGGEPSRYGNAREDNKRSRIGRVFAIVTSPARKEYMGTAPKCTNYNYHHLPEVPCCMYTNYNRFGHFAKDCRVGTRMVNLLNDRNPIAACEACFECGSTNHYKAACPRLNRTPG